jgi:hypothetical protein
MFEPIQRDYLKVPTTREQVIAALNSERAYQVRRWGFRQADGSFNESPNYLIDWMTFCRDYLVTACGKFSTDNGVGPTLEVLRKIATMALAAMEQIYPNDTRETILTGINVTDDDHPLGWFLTDVEYAIGGVINNCYRPIQVPNPQDEFNDENPNPAARFQLSRVLATLIRCFELYGVPHRDLTKEIVNGRDGQPA